MEPINHPDRIVFPGEPGSANPITYEEKITYGYDQINQPILIWKERFSHPRNMITNHHHDAFEIYYLLEGERLYFIKDRTYHVKKGDLILIDVNELHKTMDASLPQHERILVNFKKDFLPADSEATQSRLLKCFHQTTNLLRLNLGEQNVVQSLLLKMVAEDRHARPDSAFYIKLVLAELLIVVNRISEQKPAGGFEFLNTIHKKISEIVTFINHNYPQNLTLHSLAERFFISKYYLSRTFKEVTGFTLIEYLNSVRIREAQSLLKNTALNVTLIAEKVGYESLTHFGRVFKASTGLSPLKYRKDTAKRLA